MSKIEFDFILASRSELTLEKSRIMAKMLMINMPVNTELSVGTS